MKKSFKLLFAALMSMAAFVPAQADNLTVYDGADYNNYVPFYGGYFDTQNMASQMIYRAGDLQAMQGALISSLKFYVFYPETGNPLNGGKLGVSIGVTDLDQFSGYSPSLITGLTQVAEITMNPGDTEIVVNFDTPFAYTGGNLVIATNVNESAGYYEDFYFFGKNVDYYASMYRLPASGSSYAQSFGPKTTFEYTLADDYAAVSTNAIDFGKLYPEQVATRTFTVANYGKNAFTPVFSTLNAPFSIAPAAAEIAAGESVEYTVTFAPTEENDYAQTLTIDCGNAGQFEIALSGILAPIPDEIPICDGDATDQNLPFYGYYYDCKTKGQMIYTADMLSAVAGKKITSVTFYPTEALTLKGGKLQLALKAVDQDGFSTYTALTDFTTVATVAPVQGDEVLVFTLDEPYEYTGGNLAIEVTAIESGSNYPRTYFYGQEFADYYPSLYLYGTSSYSSSDKSHFLPKLGIKYVKEDTPAEYDMGDVNHDGNVSIPDVTELIDYLINDATAAPAEANVNGDEVVSIADVTALIDYLLSGAW